MQIRTITAEDHPKLHAFWETNYFVTEMDSAERFADFLTRNPDLSVLMEEDGEILGSALGSYDGRRGYLQKVVTDSTRRNAGIGSQLVKEVIARLTKAGATYIPISIEPKNLSFYEKCGFVKKDSISMDLELSREL